MPTFDEATRKVHAAKLPGFSSAKHGRNWIQMLERHVLPVFGDTPVDEIRQREVKDFFERLGPTLTETAAAACASGCARYSTIALSPGTSPSTPLAMVSGGR